MDIKTPVSESLRIVLAGNRNAGKSSLLNSIFQKDVAIVSDVAGTTTDPVSRKIELRNLGPCVITDTAGLDDVGELGKKRTEKSLEKLLESDLVLFVSSLNKEITQSEKDFYNFIKEKKLNSLLVYTFAENENNKFFEEKNEFFKDIDFIKTDNKKPAEYYENLLFKIEKAASKAEKEIGVLDGLVKKGDTVILVCPIDDAAPKARLILPQVETLRDCLDKNCKAFVCQVSELKATLDSLKDKPELVITDSQAFAEVSKIVPPDVRLTGFSILFARKKGDYDYFVKSIEYLNGLKSDAHIVIFEACSHHRQDDDIGTVKIPALLRKKISDKLVIENVRQFPDDLSSIDLVITCGGCMFSRKMMLNKLSGIFERQIPIVNYGLFLAWANGLFPRAAI
ncbi:[FeFe] hydrogenase H-cluster maturation GTPase HydF [Treponema sp.]|uniref:[FeFe] hydrogenase H-cluster maturation GTPase HydF n=1 Tax=Treponema sp. TaxID=166 RepID=UPI00298D721D|nr:[FeFe] hydrogenase H-cluster maturation GTPase HydF [Treponema sp.]